MRFVVAVGAEVWDYNPQLELYSEFSALIKKFTRKEAGNAVLCIHLAHDPASELRQGGLDDISELRERAAHQYLKKAKWSDLEEAVSKYEELLVSKAERHLEFQDKIIKKAQEVLDSWAPNKTDVVDYLKATGELQKRGTEWRKAYEEVSKEREAAFIGRAGKEKSLTERRGIR